MLDHFLTAHIKLSQVWKFTKKEVWPTNTVVPKSGSLSELPMMLKKKKIPTISSI